MQQDLQTNLTSFATRYRALMASHNPLSTRKDTAQLKELINRKLKGQHSFTREAGLNPKALDSVIMWEQEHKVRISREWRQARIRMLRDMVLQGNYDEDKKAKYRFSKHEFDTAQRGIFINGNGELSKCLIKPDVIKLKELVWEGRQSEPSDEWRVFVEDRIGLPEWEYEFVKWDLASSKEKRKLRTRRKRYLKKLARKADEGVDDGRPADKTLQATS